MVQMGGCLRHLQQKASVQMQEREREEPPSPTHPDKEPHNLENNSNPDTLDPPSASPDLPSSPPSTLLLRLAEQKLPLRPCYHLHGNILQGGPITETMRAKLRSFLMEECAKQWLLRETYSLACTLADLFFAQGGTVSVTDFQNLFLGCLILASKLKEGKFPTISFQTFSREQLMAFEIRIARQLNYNLMPHTYHSHAERIATLWDAFTEQEGEYNKKLVEVGEGGVRPLRRFYEQLDCCFMVLRTLDYDIEDLVVNLFYIHARMLNQEMPNPITLTNEQFVAAFYPKDDPFCVFFETFLHLYSHKSFELYPHMGVYLKPFLWAKPSLVEWNFASTLQAVQGMRRWQKLVSVPMGNYQLAKKVIQRNNSRGQL